MNRQKWLVFIVATALIAGTAVFLSGRKARQRLGPPGIKAAPIPDSILMKIELPAQVLDFTSTNVPQAQVVLDYLPKDTSYAQRRYTAPDGFAVTANIILMGMDRSSIHKPEICLPGQGWRIEEQATAIIDVRWDPPGPMRVGKWRLSNLVQMADGQKRTVNALYIFWFVADREQTVSHWERSWWLARDMLRTGVLQRWAYVSYFTVCEPGQEQAVFERVSRLVAESVPSFQPRPASGVAVATTR
jgi:hypothetical protein